jgi:hypothetical protein
LRPFQSSREIEIVGPANLLALVVFRSGQPQAKLVCRCFLDRDEEAPIELVAVGRKGVDLIGRVAASSKTFASSAVRIAADHDHFAVAASPLD